ncbi:MAG: amino acid permease [Planctomycetia bacterium]|nr:amino acid permease [Planctomycetia bacterium]
MQNKGLPRVLGFFDVLCLGINSVVGVGIFLLPGQLFSLAGSSVVWVFPLCGILCFAIALCFAEMGGMYHTTGGAYLYAREAFGPFVGFGWMDDMAFIHHRMGHGRQRFFPVCGTLFANRKRMAQQIARHPSGRRFECH